jgi:branched-chain amino acid aminotransferase
MQDAFARGFDEALLLNDRGEIAEGTGENIFIVKDGKVRTNDRSSDVLHGITRASVIELCTDLGIPLEVDVLSLDEIYDADEVFFTGTAAEVTPLACLDEHEFPTTRPITRRLREAYARAVAGEDPKHADWVTLVAQSAVV